MSEYAERDIMELDDLGDHFTRHVQAMTVEGLHDKHDIAAELGYRDWRITELEALLSDARAEIAGLRERLEAQDEALPLPDIKSIGTVRAKVRSVSRLEPPDFEPDP